MKLHITETSGAWGRPVTTVEVADDNNWVRAALEAGWAYLKYYGGTECLVTEENGTPVCRVACEILDGSES